MTGINLYDVNFWFGVLGVISAIIPFAAYLLKRKNYEISCHVEGFNKILNEKNSDVNGFRLLYDSSVIYEPTKLYTFNCFLQNTGIKDIGSDLVKNPIKISVPKALKIISATSIDSPEPIQSIVSFDSDKGEIVVAFDLLQTGEVIKIKLVIELAMDVPVDKIWKLWRQIDIDFRIRNIKSVPWQFVPNRTHASLFIEALLSILVIPVTFVIMWIAFNRPYKLVENKYVTEYNIENRKFYGDLFFVNNDTIGILFIDGNRIDTLMPKGNFFKQAKIKRWPIKKATELPEFKMMIIVFSLLLIPMAYTPCRRYHLRRMLDKAHKKSL